MQPALRLDARQSGAHRVPVALLCGRYSIIGKLRTQGRADISIGLPEGACSVDELVVIKTLPSDALEGVACEVPPEIELSSTLRHDNLVRTLGVGHEAGRHFIVSEYLEGVTLRRLLRWLSAQGQKLPNAAIARILLGIFAAVEHADRFARTPDARAIVHQPIGADDVFVTYDGSVKLLGFKTEPARVAAAEGHPSGAPAAVDDLLSNQRSPELSAVLARIGNRVSAASLIGLWQIARMLQIWQTEELESDGRAELAAIMAGVLPEGRAKRRAQLATACARALREGALGGESGDVAESPPVSGYRSTRLDGPLGAVSVRSWPPPEVAAPTVALARLASSDAPAGYRMPIPRGRRSLGWRWPTRSWISSTLLLTALGLAIFGVRYPDRLEPGSAAVIPTDVAAADAVPAELQPPPRSAVAPGAHRAAPAPVTSADGVAWRSFTPVRAASPVGVTSATLPRSLAARGRSPNDARPPLSSPQAPAPSAPAPSASPGYLTLDTTPWSAVSTGNVSLGQTPLVRVQLPPGQHVLELDNEELGIATSVIVDIGSGETTVRRIGLERPVHAAGP